MEIFNLVLRIIFGLFLAYAGVMHFIKPKFFNGFIPKPFPKLLSNYIAGIVELAIGLGLFFDATTKIAAIAFFVLMLLFSPIHIWDYFKEKPAVGSKKIAIIRIVLQFVLLYIAYFIYIKS